MLSGRIFPAKSLRPIDRERDAIGNQRGRAEDQRAARKSRRRSDVIEIPLDVMGRDEVSDRRHD
jgi:hypothetical protein